MTDLKEKILRIKKEKNAIVLAHYYQEPDIQDIADYVGDSLGLSKKAAETNAEIIVFAGVYFMAETAKVINPDKRVFIPDERAGCSLADSCPSGSFKALLDKHPDHVVVSYVNCSAEIKAMSDYICTSSNALKIVESLPKEQPIIFAPDKNLGAYINHKTGRNMILWNGHCVVHAAFSMEKLLNLAKQHPEAVIIAHPESEAHILEAAQYVGSTSGMINYVKSSPAEAFIVATEAGILYKMQQEAPEKTLIPAPSYEENSCNCSECAFMKMNTLQKVYDCLLNETPEVFVPEEVRLKALVPIERMLRFN